MDVAIGLAFELSLMDAPLSEASSCDKTGNFRAGAMKQDFMQRGKICRDLDFLEILGPPGG